MVCPLFSNFSKREVSRVKCCIKVPGQHRAICVQCTAADIPECTYVQSKSVQNKPSCAVEAVTSVDSRSNVLGCSQTTADSKQKHYFTVHVMQDLCTATNLPNSAVWYLLVATILVSELSSYTVGLVHCEPK